MTITGLMYNKKNSRTLQVSLNSIQWNNNNNLEKLC